MSAFNAEKTIEQAVDSILDQTYKDFIFLVIDDSSTDLTGSILLDYECKNNNLHIYFNDKRVGLTKNLNTLIDRAIHLYPGIKYIARQDADDWSELARLKIQVEFMDENPEFGMCGTRYIQHREEGGKIPVKLPIEDIDIRKETWFANRFGHGSCMYRLSSLKELKYNEQYYDEYFFYGQDLELHMRMMENFLVYNIPEYLYNFRLSKGSIDRADTYEKMYRTAIYKMFCRNMGIDFIANPRKEPFWLKQTAK